MKYEVGVISMFTPTFIKTGQLVQSWMEDTYVHRHHIDLISLHIFLVIGKWAKNKDNQFQVIIVIKNLS
jgi:hypothetical protein